jgi:ABC-2 type transport system permease protein
MALNICRHEFKMRLGSVVTWSAAIAVLILVFVALFSSFAPQAALMNEMMARFPKPLLAAFGLNGTDLSTVLGYFGFVFLFVQICLAVQAANYGFSLVSVEEREWTADFLLTRPVPRRRILTSKLLAALGGLTVTNLVVWAGSLGFVELFRAGRTYDTGILVLLLLSVAVFQTFFLSVGLVISLLVKKLRNVMPYSMGLGLGMYVLSIFGNMLGTSVLEKVSPFKHFEPNYIIRHGAYDLPLVLLSVAVVVMSVVGSYVLYARRDIPAVA